MKPDAELNAEIAAELSPENVRNWYLQSNSIEATIAMARVDGIPAAVAAVRKLYVAWMRQNGMFDKPPTKGRVAYPDAPERTLDAPPRIWDRYQIVIPCFDAEQADRISAAVAKICGHSLERIWAATDDGGTELFGAVVMERRIVPNSARTLLESQE